MRGSCTRKCESRGGHTGHRSLRESGEVGRVGKGGGGGELGGQPGVEYSSRSPEEHAPETE